MVAPRLCWQRTRLFSARYGEYCRHGRVFQRIGTATGRLCRSPIWSRGSAGERRNGQLQRRAAGTALAVAHAATGQVSDFAGARRAVETAASTASTRFARSGRTPTSARARRATSDAGGRGPRDVPRRRGRCSTAGPPVDVRRLTVVGQPEVRSSAVPGEFSFELCDIGAGDAR